MERVFPPGELERLYRSLVEHSRDGVFLVQHGIIVFCNDALASALDFSVDELTGTSYVARVAADDRAAQMQRRAAREGGSMDTQQYEVRLLRRDGTPRLFEVRAGAVVYRGEPASIGTMRDVTELREQQQRLAEAEEHYRLALWGSGDRLFDWDLATGTLRPLSTNLDADAESYRPVALSSAEGLAQYLHPDDIAQYVKGVEQHLAGETPYFEAAYRLRSRDGEWRWKLARGMIVARDEDGKPLRMSGTQKDISKIKAAEAALLELTRELDSRVQERTRELQDERRGLELANQRLECAIGDLQRTQGELVEAEKMASLGRLVAGVAHEVNTPLGVGMTAISFLRGRTGALREGLTLAVGAARTAELLTPIESAAEMAEANLVRAANLVRSFKQVAVDQGSSEIRAFVLRDYLAGIVQSLHPALKQAGVEAEVACDPLIEVRSRPDALYQVVSNLVMNSLVHAYPEGVRGSVRISAQLQQGLVLLRYEDDGAGMDAAVAARIFEPFFTTRRAAGGTGLGMHIVYNLVARALAGRITLQTAPGEGVRFDVVFPRVHPGAA